MKVSFITPSIPDKYFGRREIGFLEKMPLGLLSLASFCQKDFDVKIFDYGGMSEKELTENITNFCSFDVVCITLTSISYYIVKKLVRKIKDENDEILIILGGAHPSALPLETIQEIDCDLIISGEGETVLYDILKFYEKNRKNNAFYDYLDAFKCVTYRNKDHIAVGNESFVIDQLRTLPVMDYSLLDVEHYTNLSVLTSRGCNAKCIFCAGALIGGMYRRRELASIFVELKEGLNSIKHEQPIFIVDNNFMGEKIYIEELIDRIERENLNRFFSFESRIGDFDENIFKKMFSYKFAGIQFGIESGSDRILKKIGKGVTKKEILEVVEKTLAIGFTVATSFIVGHPFETDDDLKETETLIRELKSLGAQAAVGSLVPYPGTLIFKNRDKLKVNIHTFNWEEYYEYNPIISTRYFSRDQLAETLFRIISDCLVEL